MIQRDGACTSLWQQDMEPYQVNSQPNHSLTYDVAIIGGGITGISTAWLLQRAGKNCIVLEAANIGFGTTGGTTAHLNTLMDTPYTTISRNFGEENAKLVARAAADAISLIKKNITELNIDCGFEDVDAFLFSQTKDQSKELKDIQEASKEAGLDISYTDKIPVPMPFDNALIIKGQAKFHPLKYVYALAAAFENAGGVIIQDARVLGIEGDDVLQVTTGHQVYTAKAAIYATHIPIGVNLLHLRCAPWRSYAMAVRLKNENDYPEGLAYDSEDPYHYYRSQNVGGQMYLIAGGKDHKTAHEENTDNCFQKLEAQIRTYFDIEEISFKWSSQYFEPTDGLPYIGKLPGHAENVYVASGFGGNGMTYSSVAALTLTGILTNEENPYIKLFDPNRIKPVAGFVNFIKHNANAAGEWLSRLWPADKMHELVELSPGEGKIVTYEGETIALYKDEGGQLHAVHPGCTHLKCSVAFNTAEASWDCPCHGARFDVDGNVLTGPAAMKLHTAVLS